MPGKVAGAAIADGGHCGFGCGNALTVQLQLHHRVCLDILRNVHRNGGAVQSGSANQDVSVAGGEAVRVGTAHLEIYRIAGG